MRHWSREGPPTYIAAAAYLGLRRPQSGPVSTIEGEDLVDLLAAFPGAQF
jgi:hypothetical protein